MCGVFGRFDRQGHGPDITSLCGATNLLAHRGPDDATWWADGPFFFGHRRLSIIDVAGGSQPMASDDGRFVIAFNGEIYNYVELREELRRLGAHFRTTSDTEILLLGYREWGHDLPRRLIGMFAFAIADRVTQSLFLCRDRFGEKPLFIHETERAITFASELKALTALAEIPREIDEHALGAYLCLNYVPLDRTMLRGVRRLPAATWREYSAAGVSSGRYWRATASLTSSRSEDEAADEFRALLDDSVRYALRSDVPATLFLSGGVDSSLIAESAVRQGSLSSAYCLAPSEPGFSEVNTARLVADALGIELRPVAFNSAALSRFLDCVGHADDPLGDSSALAVWTLAETAGQDYKVAITGDGGDELFAGYLTYKASLYHRYVIARLPWWLRRTLARSASAIPVTAGKVSASYQCMRFLRAAAMPTSEAHLSWNGTWLPDDAARLVSPFASKAAAEALQTLAAAHHVRDEDDLRALQAMDADEYLSNDILVKVDRMTMAHGLESRAPLLAPALAEFASTLPEQHTLRLWGSPKRLLRRVTRRIYGDRIAGARKQGFSIPVHGWLRGAGKPLVERFLNPQAVTATGLLDEREVARAVAAHQSERAQLGFELWGLMVLVAWHEMRVASRPIGRSDGLRQIVLPAPLGHT